MKKFLIILVILAIAFIAVKLSIKSPDQSIPSATDATSTQQEAPSPTATAGGENQIAPTDIVTKFTGYGPGGKIEHGTVKVSTSTLKETAGVFSGGVTFDMSTIKDDAAKAKLETHLKSTDFFDVVKYPTATFTVTSATAAQVKGNLTMKGVTKPVTLPITFDPNQGYLSTVRVNMEDFGIKQTFTDKEFVLEISVAR
jgi:polyisoprenoid-binding protein YceI